ncbi:MAG: HAD family hydrolase [Pseudomonadota bacterium]
MNETILSFDAGDTLVRVEGVGLVSTALCVAQAELGPEHHDYRLERAIAHFVVKETNLNEAVEAFSSEIGLSDHKAIVRAYRPPSFVVDSRSNDLLSFGKQEGFKMILLSNTTPWDCADYDQLGIAEFMDAMFFSFDIGVAKPSEAAFRIVEKSMNARSGQIVHVGNDKTMDFDAAQAAGWKAVLSNAQNNGAIVDKRAEEMIREIRALVDSD